MTNEIQRKITSLTLMTIMLAGGMTIGFSGFTPDAYAVNANLLVSAENTGGYVDGAQIIEIVVIDDDLNHPSTLPDITINGDAVTMTATTDGNWYAYIADTDAVAAVDNEGENVSGIDFGTPTPTDADETNTCLAAGAKSDSNTIYCNVDTGTSQNVPAAVKTPSPANANWPYIQTYDFSSNIEIQYNKAGGTQTTTLSFDDNADGLTLDRSDYSPGAQIHVTIGDHRLNIDPTTSDTWIWNMLNDDKYYGTDIVGVADRVNAPNVALVSTSITSVAASLAYAEAAAANARLYTANATQAFKALGSPTTEQDPAIESIVDSNAKIAASLKTIEVAFDNVDISDTADKYYRTTNADYLTNGVDNIDFNDNAEKAHAAFVAIQAEIAIIVPNFLIIHDGSSDVVTAIEADLEIIDLTALTSAVGLANDAAMADNLLSVNANNISDESIKTNQVCADCSITVNFNRNGSDRTVVIDGIENRLLPAAGDWFTVREIGGPNTAVFSATTLADESIFAVAGDAPRDSSATITYDGTVTGILIEHSQATINIQSPDDVWTSGLAIPITLVDDDANKNSQDSDDVVLTDPVSIIPTLVTGDPFTLGEDLGNMNEATGNKNDLVTAVGTYTTGNSYTDNNNDVHAEPATAIVEQFSDRAILSFVESHTGLGYLAIDIPEEANDLRDTLIDTSDGTEHGVNMLNYNVESLLDATLVSIQIISDEIIHNEGRVSAPTTVTITEVDNTQSGYINISDLLEGETDDGNTMIDQIQRGVPLQLRLNFADTLSITADKEYPIVIDFFSFGYENDGEASDERIANQIIRILLEESGDQGTFEGTLEYVMINQLNIVDPATYEGLVTIGNEVIFIVIEDLTGSSAPSVTYLDVDPTGIQTQVSAQQDAPSHSAVVTLDVDSFKTADTVTVTLQDLDLNVDSGLVDIYTLVDRVYEKDNPTGDFKFDSGNYTIYVEDGVYLDDKGTLDPVDDEPIDKYTNRVTDANFHAVGASYGEPKYDGAELGRLLEITFDDERWMDHTYTDEDGNDCTNLLREQDREYNTGLGDTNFSLIETGDATGIFVGTFQVPAEFCRAESDEPESVTGLDIEVNYVDFRDASGETTEVGDSAGIKAHTGSVSLDRTVYPVPFGVAGDFEKSSSTTPSERNSETRSLFPIHQIGMSDAGELTPGLDDGEFLPQGDLIVYVTVTDSDFDVSASGKDSIAIDDTTPVTVSVIRGSETVTVAQIGDQDSPIDEIAPDAGIFESSVTIRYNDGPTSTLCSNTPIGYEVGSRDYYNANNGIGYTPATSTEIPDEADRLDHNENLKSERIDEYRDLVRNSISGIDFDERVLYNVGHQSWEIFYGEETGDIVYHDGCILQGDILQVEYNDPTDASGKPNSVTDSATFDLRNGVLQSDKSVYIIGSDMILTLIEPDLDLDSSQNETYDLDLIKWSSSAATVTMGDADGDDIASAFDPEPLSFRETGPSTGIFQIVIEIPQELDGSFLQRGEEIDLEYTDWGPSGSDYVGDEDEDIRLTVFTSNFGATIDLDQKVYSWTDKVYITIVAPDHNFDNDLIDEIGESDDDPLRIATKGFDLDNYRLVETGFDTGIFTGEVILTGFEHDPSGDGIRHLPIKTSGDGPTDGYLETPSDGGISVSYEFSEDETVFTSSIVRWNIGDVQWLEASYPASATGVLRIIDPDMNLNPEAVDNLDVNIASNTDASGITLTVTETNEATGIFEGTVFFTTTGGSSGHRLRVSEGDTVTADYADGTLPLPYTTNDSVSITSTTIIGTIVPPLERAPATNLRIVDTFGSSIDAVSVDQQVQITADLSSGQDKDQDFAYLIQIQNSDGVTVSLSWIAGALSSGQSFSPSASWTPTSAGTYTVTAFVWESIDNPTALSPPLSIDISVN